MTFLKFGALFSRDLTRYLQLYGFELLFLVSFGILVVKLLPRFVQRVIGHVQNREPGYQPLLSQDNAASYGTKNQDESEDGFTTEDAHQVISRERREYDSVFGASPLPTRAISDSSDITSTSSKEKDDRVIIATIVRSTYERVRVAVEAIFVAARTALAAAAFIIPAIRNEWESDTPNVPIVLLVFWCYCLALVLIRLAYMQASTVPSGGLWYHSTVMYLFAFVFSLITLNSTLMHPFSKVSSNYYFADTFLSTGLFVLNFSAKIGNRPARLYMTSKGPMPSPEPVSSLFQLVSFSWLDPLVWKGYWEPLNMEDIWDLREDDRAVHVLKKFRSVSNYYSFGVRMIIHFKRELFVSGCWAIFYSFLTFGPSMLLMKVLEYVQDQSTMPRHVAWLYVTAFFVFGVITNVGSGQALFIGRRICIRMRAIIIGEVYAKALRRKAVSGSDSALGKDKNKLDSNGNKLADTKPSKNDKDTVDDNEDKDKVDGDKSSGSQANLGAITNLMAVDAFKVSELAGYLHYFVQSILTLCICVVFLYAILSWSALVGLATVIIMTPLTYWFASMFGRYQDELMSATDQRVEKTNELLQSIRIIKYFAWERKFTDGVLKIREKELKILKKSYVLWSFSAAVWTFTPLVLTVSTFGSYTLIQKKELTAPVAFTALSLLNILRHPLDQFADMLSRVMQAKVSVDRVEQFLKEGETHKYDQLSHNQARGPNSPYIGFEQASFSWFGKELPKPDETAATSSNSNKAKKDFKLRNLNLAFSVGKLNVIIGPTGSGKSSLLMALLGEMELDEGRVFLPGAGSRENVRRDPNTGMCETVSYCSQQAWLLNDTIKNNILFASDYNEERYNAVIEACALSRDLEILDGGDETEVGEKGIALSGGQKQRISLARAMYSPSRHLLLDDCLSAVDSHTSLLIYENCLCGPLAENRTIILVSHNVALTIKQADLVVVMNNGRVQASGSPIELLDKGELGEDDLVKNSAVQSSSQPATRVQSEVNLAKHNVSSSKSLSRELADKLSKKSGKQKNTGSSSESESESDLNSEETLLKKKKAGVLIKEEERSTGYVNKEVYKYYLKSLGNWMFWVVIITLFIIDPAVLVSQSWWLKIWVMSDSKKDMITTYGRIGTFGDHPVFNTLVVPIKSWMQVQASETLHTFQTNSEVFYYLGIYVLIGILFMVVVVLKQIVVFIGTVRGSRVIFRELLESVVKARIRFFDSTPVGRIMNRFSKDMEGIDQDLSPVFEGTIDCILSAVSVTVVIIIVTPSFLLAGIGISAIYWLIGTMYLSTSRELKRLDAISKSPIYQHFGETLVGISTIRAYGDEKRFIRDNLTKIDCNNRPFFFMWVSNRWLSFRIDTAGALVAFCAAGFVLLNIDRIDAGLAGLSLSYALSFNDDVLWIVRLYAVMEMNMNSVERVREYMHVEKEAPAVIENSPATPDWPTKGSVEFSNLSLRYDSNLPLVIKNVSFKVDPCSKVGIVGRTGAGKSTIITALFRFLEADSGSILIDGIDISKVGLEELRTKLAIIPQDPTLFTGTIRFNLDPFSMYSDQEIFRALRSVHLIPRIPDSDEIIEHVEDENFNKFLDLSSPVAEGGNNLSQGQRQLMCLARSLLKYPKILLLDEATASIDYDTDTRIQKTIREEFSNTTILTIAHRLRSIADYDKILVMNAGEVVEFDTPHNLLQKKDSLFRDMCVKSGELEALEQLAESAHTRTNLI